MNRNNITENYLNEGLLNFDAFYYLFEFNKGKYNKLLYVNRMDIF